MSLQQLKFTTIPKKLLTTISGGHRNHLGNTSGMVLPADIDPNDPEAVRQYLIRQSWIGSGPGGQGISPIG